MTLPAETDLIDAVRQAAKREGFALLGVTPAVNSVGYADLVRWIESGYAAGMSYFADRREAYRHPTSVLAGAKSVIALALPYAGSARPKLPSGYGRVARYAWSGDDYHDLIHAKLKRICRELADASAGRAGSANPTSTATDDELRIRGVVDTAPLMEREIAELAGLGWRGKNTLLLNKRHGSYFFLACLLVNVELPYDAPFESFHCGTCTACLTACPTAAFPQPGVLDASRCISYLTIEHRGVIPTEFREAIGDWLFGCDVCQEVCPWNRQVAREPAGEQPHRELELAGLFALDDESFRQQFRRTPFWRPRRRGLLRNAAIVLANQGDENAIPTLVAALNDQDAIVRATVAWALGQFGDEVSRAALADRQRGEQDADVRSEIRLALHRCREPRLS